MTTTTSERKQARPLPRGDRKIIVTLLIATFVVILNETIMGVAIPHLITDLDITASTAQWLSTAFLLTMAVVIPTTGFLLQRLSRRTVFSVSMGLFCLGTAVAAISPGFWLLLLGRIIQASGTAIMLPLLMTTILTLVPLERRGQVMGNVSIAISVAPAIGPTISGVILQYLPWRFMFVLVLPFAVGALVYGARGLRAGSEPGNQRLDLVSVLLSVPAFGALVYGLSRIGEGGAAAAVPLALGVVCLLLFGWRQIRLQSSNSPLLDLRAFAYPMFRRSVALLCIAMMALFGTIILLPIYLQEIRRLGSLETGLLLLPGGVLMGLLAPSVGRLFDRYGPRGLTTAGALLMTATMWGFSTVDAGTPVWQLVAMHLTLSVALALLFTPGFTSGLNPLPPQLYSHGSAIMTTLQQVAGAAGTALLVAIMAARSLQLDARGDSALGALNGGISTAFLAAALISVPAVAVALSMRRAAAGTPSSHDIPSSHDTPATPDALSSPNPSSADSTPAAH